MLTDAQITALYSDWLKADKAQDIFIFSRAIEAAVRKEPDCIICGGSPPVSGKPCVCGGTGKAADAMQPLLNRIYDLEQKSEADARDAARLLALLKEAALALKADTTRRSQSDLQFAMADKIDAAMAEQEKKDD